MEVNKYDHVGKARCYLYISKVKCIHLKMLSSPDFVPMLPLTRLI